MTIQTSYSEARDSFDALLDTVTDNREVVIIERPGAEDVALIAADELRSLLETAHLLRSPANAERLLTALARVRRDEGQAQTLDALCREVGLSLGSAGFQAPAWEPGLASSGLPGFREAGASETAFPSQSLGTSEVPRIPGLHLGTITTTPNFDTPLELVPAGPA